MALITAISNNIQSGTKNVHSRVGMIYLVNTGIFVTYGIYDYIIMRYHTLPECDV
jgi:hypothetical protein